MTILLQWMSQQDMPSTVAIFKALIIQITKPWVTIKFKQHMNNTHTLIKYASLVSLALNGWIKYWVMTLKTDSNKTDLRIL